MDYIVKRGAFLLKSLFYQGNMNSTNMQGTGFAWMVRPFIDKKCPNLSPGDAERLSGYFTTNPSFITLLAGIFVREYGGGKEYSIKNIYASVFAALGDSFFWHALRPLLFMATLFIMIFVSPWGVALYPVVFSVFHLSFLMLGGLIGSMFGDQAITVFNRFRFNRWADFADGASLFILGALTSQLLKKCGEGDIVVIFAALAVLLLGAAAQRLIRLSIFLWVLILLIMAVLGFYGGY